MIGKPGKLKFMRKVPDSVGKKRKFRYYRKLWKVRKVLECKGNYRIYRKV